MEFNDELDMVNIYKSVLTGRISRFPRYTWTKPEGYKNAIPCIKYLIENILEWNEDDVKRNLSLEIFQKHNLGGMITRVFSSSPFAALNQAYPGKYKPWELSVAPIDTWDLDMGKESFIWLIEEKLEWSDKDIKEKLNLQVLKDNGLSGMIDKVFNRSVFKALDTVYPNRFKPWELSVAPKNTWDIKTCIKAFHWLLEDKLDWTEEDIKNNLSLSILTDNGLLGMLYTDHFKGSLRSLITASYPHIPLEEIKSLKEYRNNKENASKIIKETIDIHAGNDVDKIKELISQKFLIDNNLQYLIVKHFNNSVAAAIEYVYPGKFKAWEIGGQVAPKFWCEANIKDATRWLVEEKLNISPKFASISLRYDDFYDYSLGGIINYKTPQEALKLAYPDLKPYTAVEIYKIVLSGKIKRYPIGFWNKDGIDKATDILNYLINEKLKISKKDIEDNYNYAFCKKYRINSALEPLGLTPKKLLNLIEIKRGF